MKYCYVPRYFIPSSMRIIDSANEIIEDYSSKGYTLTLRQLYYQFVSRDLLPNTMKSYNRLGSIINDARLAGLIDWEAIEDRTRSTSSNSHWDSPGQIVSACADQYQVDKWQEQEYRPEVWVEKEALAGIVEQACSPLDVSFLSCKGYTSQSEMWRSAMRQKRVVEKGQIPVIIHLGDHDPSGIDMTRDIGDRLLTFFEGEEITVDRIALNMDQIRKFKPPPNPAKVTDSRFVSYMKVFGTKSWELDALPPEVLFSLIQSTILTYRNENTYKKWKKVEDKAKADLLLVAEEMG